MRKGRKMSRAQRRRLSRALMRPEVRQRKREIAKALWRDPEHRKRVSEGQKAAWADPEIRERIIGAAKSSWTDPQKRKRHIRGIKRAQARPEVQEAKSESLKRTLADPEIRERMSKARKAEWKDPVIRERKLRAIRKSNLDPRRLKNMGKGVKAVWDSYTPEQRAARIEAMQSARNAVYRRGARPKGWDKWGTVKQSIYLVMVEHPDVVEDRVKCGELLDSKRIPCLHGNRDSWARVLRERVRNPKAYQAAHSYLSKIRGLVPD